MGLPSDPPDSVYDAKLMSIKQWSEATALAF